MVCGPIFVKARQRCCSQNVLILVVRRPNGELAKKYAPEWGPN